MEGFVSRQRLTERIQTGANGRVTIISAPPGFGKTTFLSAWLAKAQTIKVAWYSLDEDDNEPRRFFAYIAASLSPIEPVSSLELLLEAGVPNPRELTVALINDISEFSSKSVILVLDDYHQITHQPIHDALAYLIDHIPNNIHLVFISRTDPPLPLGRWRVRGQLTEIRADDLRFNGDETAQFLNQTMGLSLSAEDIRTLEARTEGWVAGLQLAALSLKKSTNPSEVISAFAGSNRYVAEYLTDEVLSRQSESLRDFLLKTSILERFNMSLCNHILQSNQSESMLTELERTNLFIIPLDSNSDWFRYHHLFKELLHRRLTQTNQTHISALHRRAAEWLEQNNFLLDAIRHWIAAGEPERVASLAEHAFSQTWGQADLAGLMKRVESLPASVLGEHPSLSAFLGWSWFWLGHDSEKILPLLERAEKNLHGKPDASCHIGRFNVIRSFLRRAVNTDSQAAILLGEQALEQLADDDLLWRGFAELNIAAATHSMGSDLAQAEEAYNETIHLCQTAGDFTTAWVAACARVQVVTERGELGRARMLNAQLLDDMKRKGSTSTMRGWAHINQAGLMYQVNDLEAAWRETNIAIELEKQTGSLPDVELRLFGLLTKLERLRGDESVARHAASELIIRMKRGGVTNAIDRANSIYAELMFRLEDWSAFDAWAQSYHPPQQPLFFPYRLATLMYTRFLTRQKAWEEARRLVEEQARLAYEAGYVEYEMELDIVRAILEMEAGRSTESMQAITHALKIGAPNRYTRIFLDEGEKMKSILSQVQKTMKDDALRTYCEDLLSAFGAPVQVDQSTLIEPLTEREIDVLKLITEGMSNPEIAEKLFLAVGTVKTHVKHIYGKLGVDDRVTAASRARELGLSN